MKPYIPSSELTRRRILQGCAAMAITSQLPGCTSASGTPNNSAAAIAFSVNPQPMPAGPMTAATLSVSTTVAGVIPPAFVGLGYEKSRLYVPLFSESNTNLISLFNALSASSVIRIGGNSVDATVWAPNGPGLTTGQVAPSDVDTFARFVKATGWKVIYGINLGGSGTGLTTPALAAAEAAYAANALGSSLLGIELGNEPDNWYQTYYPAGLSEAQYFTLWTTYRNAILATTPGLPFIGPATSTNPQTWTATFAESATSKELAMITQHYYRADGSLPTSTAAVLLTPDTRLTGYILPPVQAASQQTGIPYRLGECNTYWDGGAPGVSNAYVSSLWALDFCLNMVQAKCAGGNFQTGTPSSYSPITNSPTGVITAVNPLYYGLYFFNLLGPGNVYQCTLAAGSLNVTAYAVATPTGGLNVLISNKDLTQNLNVAITLPQTANRALLALMTQLSPGASGPSLAGLTGVTIQGGSIGVNASFSPNALNTLTTSGKQLNCYVPALSAVVIQIT
jgi:hypothetical protein